MPKRNQKRVARCRIPKRISEGTDRGIMEWIFGKRAMRQVDKVLEQANGKCKELHTPPVSSA